MEQTQVQAGHPTMLIPYIILTVFIIFIINRLAKEKGLNVILWTILACIPFLNFIILPYIIGTPSRIQEKRINEIFEILKKGNQ